MNKTPTISIMIPVYNTGQYLERCINSVIKQTFKDIEIILVDDGSTDGSGDYCDKCAKIDARIKVVHKPNGGLGSARIAGIECATGMWLGFVDSDDWIEPNMYQELYESAQVEEGIDIAIGGYVEEKEAGVTHIFTTGRTRVMNPHDALLEMFACCEYNWSLCDKLYRRSLFDVELVKSWPMCYGEDTYINWKVFNKARRIIYSPIMGYHYFMNSESVMHKRITKEKFDYCRIYKDILNNIDIQNDENKELSWRIMDIALKSCLPIIHYAQQEYDLYNEEIEAAIEQMRSYLEFLYETEEKESIDTIDRMFAHVDTDNASFQKAKKQRDDELRGFADGEKVFLYGAGEIAKDIFYLLKQINVEIRYVVVSELRDDNTCFCGMEVIDVHELVDNSSPVKVVLAMNNKNTKEVLDVIGSNQNIRTINAGKYSIFY